MFVNVPDEQQTRILAVVKASGHSEEKPTKLRSTEHTVHTPVCPKH